MNAPFAHLAGLAAVEEQRVRIEFVVRGIPEPKGSTQSFSPKGTSKVITTSANPKLKGWASLVIDAAAEAFEGRAPLDCPILVAVTFTFARKASHFGTGRNAGQLLSSAPRYPSTKPDLDKLIRGVLDGITQAGCWRDDARVVEIRACKEYGDKPGARVRIEAAEQHEAER
jgi:Holliday junction resolvase RusA-like endonuclease